MKQEVIDSVRAKPLEFLLRFYRKAFLPSVRPTQQHLLCTLNMCAYASSLVCSQLRARPIRRHLEQNTDKLVFTQRRVWFETHDLPIVDKWLGGGSSK